ncbi:MAG: hypothetical protein ACFFB5_04490 [Promethearchaeota archaeon]
MSNNEFEGTLVYSEFDEKAGPVIRAIYPNNLYPEEIKRIAAMSMPGIGQQDEFFDVDGAGFTVFQVSEQRIVYSFYKFLRGGVRTLSGASIASLSFVTEQTINPFRFKPFLGIVLTSLFRIVVDANTLKQIYDGLSQTGIIDKQVSVKGPPIRVRARIIQENELPVYYIELEKDLGRL